MGTVHVIGAGLSGLSCAVRCARAGKPVVLYEAAPRAGGRCRSFSDEGLGCLIDNGNHLLLGANTATLDYLADIGSRQLVTEIDPAQFPFLEPSPREEYALLPYMKSTGEMQWSLRPGSPWLPTWLLSPRRRLPGTAPSDYVRDMIRLLRAGPRDTVLSCVGQRSALFERLWQPMSRAVLNTDATEGSARLLRAAVAGTFLKGEKACRPMIFEKGLSPALVTPALRLLERTGAVVRFQARVRGLRWQENGIVALRFPEGLLKVEMGDAVVLAVPPDACAELWPDSDPPHEVRPIVNIHFRLSEPVALPGGLPFLGLIGTEAQWLFARDDVLSVTISAATGHVDRPNWEIANQIWAEITRILGRNMGRLPPWRVIKERRATIAQTPEVAARRPGAETILPNLFLAGDWTDTGLPATIEGSIRSGATAARHAIACVTRKMEAS